MVYITFSLTIHIDRMPLRAKVFEKASWYFQPRFFVKLIWGIFALGLAIVLITFSGKENDQFWTLVVGKQPHNFLVWILILFLLAVAATLVAFFVEQLEQYRKYILIGVAVDTVIFIIVGFVFVHKYGTITKREQIYQTVVTYYKVNMTSSDATIKAAIEWFEANVGKEGDADFHDEVWNYVDDRTEDIGSAIIGCYVVWGIFDVIWMWHLFNGEKPECWDPNGGYVNPETA